MSTQGLLFGTAAVFLFLAVVGGGVSVKEIAVPKIPGIARIALAALGVGAAVLAMVTNPSDSEDPSAAATPATNVPSSTSIHNCRHPVVVPAIADGSHTEEDARRLLSDAGLLNVLDDPRFDPNAPKGLVVEVTPGPGSVLCPRDALTITVTR